MGGRGARSGLNPHQMTIDQYNLLSEIAEIRRKGDRTRTSLGIGSGAGQGGVLATRRKRCKCCGELTLPALSKYVQCMICGWIDDPYQNSHPDSLNGKNALTLNEARMRYHDEKSNR